MDIHWHHFDVTDVHRKITSIYHFKFLSRIVQFSKLDYFLIHPFQIFCSQQTNKQKKDEISFSKELDQLDAFRTLFLFKKFFV